MGHQDKFNRSLLWSTFIIIHIGSFISFIGLMSIGKIELSHCHQCYCLFNIVVELIYLPSLYKDGLENQFRSISNDTGDRSPEKNDRSLI